jgi:periplasmic protein CpxP/Spy
MKALLIAAFGLALTYPTLAQTPPSENRQTEQGNPALKSPQSSPDKSGTASPASGSRALSGLEAGSNSFTEGQARSRLEEAGYTNVTELKKNDQGIWQGKAQNDGRSITVGLDYKGNIGVE